LGSVDQFLEVGKADGAADGVAVDEEEGGAVHSQAVAFLTVGLDGGLEEEWEGAAEIEDRSCASAS
jgi:hypothetical protein